MNGKMFLFIAGNSRNLLCIACENSQIIEDVILIDAIKRKQNEIEEKLKLVVGSDLRKEYMIKTKKLINKKKTIYICQKKLWKCGDEG